MKIFNLKRILSALLLAAMVISLCACSPTEATGTGSGSDDGAAAVSGNGSGDLRMVGTVRTTYDDYLKANPDYKMIYADPIEADLSAAVFSMETEFEPVGDEPEAEAETEQPAGTEAEAETETEQSAEAETEQSAEAEEQPESAGYTAEDFERVGSYEGREGNIIVWKNAEGRLDVKFNVEKAGRYAVWFDYFALSDEARTIELEMYVNGKKTFSQAERINMTRLWHNENDTIEQDVRGNDLNPSQVAYKAWIKGPVRDNEGLYDAPFTFCFDAGENTVTIIGARAQFAIAGISLYNTPDRITYAEYSKNASPSENNYYGLVQGEMPSYTCDPALHPIYDRSSVNTIPADPILLKRNTMGGGNWASQGQYAVYTFDVPAEGWYKIAVRYRQNVARGLKTYRRVYVNGEVPFAEADCLTFEYSDYWQKTVLGEIDNNDEPYLFHLNAGKNEIRIEAITGPTGSIIAELDDMVYEFNYIYRKIIMITGLDPDPYRDYHLESDIPSLLPTFQRLKEQCESIKERLIEIRGGSSSSEVASLTNMSVQLKSLLKDPETIPVRLSMFKDNISALAALSVKLKEQPLEIDYLTVTAKGVDEFVEDKGFFKNLAYKIKAYFATYVEDYNSVGSNAEGEDVLRVWVNLGRDQANLIKEMSDSDFTSKTGIRVKVSLVQQSLIQANIANDGPDVVLFVGGGDVVNLSAREALVDMSQFKSRELTGVNGEKYTVSSYDEVMSRFSKYAGEPYRFTDKTGHTGHYSIPITENFNMLFYRTDIFDELGLEPPKTWDEFYKVLTVLQNNNMQVGIPNGSDSAVDSGIFLTLLKQNGLSLYSDDLKKTNLDTTTALAVFKQWTGFYSQYSMPQRYDLYTRFRTGEMPMGFAGYTFVNQLNYAAPELKGLWEMTTIPGTVMEDGTVNNIDSGGGAGALIYRRAVKRGVADAAWAYIDWFTSEDAQAKYGFDIETLLGAAGRYDTANRAAAERLPWSAKEWKVLKEQWDNMFINPVVIGDYYYSRNITFAFRNVVIYSKNPREMLLSYNKEINAEITTKRKEFGLEVDEK